MLECRLMKFRGIPGLFVGNLLFLGNGQGIDAQVVADGRDDDVRPVKVHNEREEEVRPEVVQLKGSTDGGEAQPGQVSEDDAANEGSKHDGPVGEGLASQVRENDLGGESAKDKGHGKAEQDEVVILHQGAVRRVDPCADAQSKDSHGRPLGKDGQDGQTLLSASAGYIVQTKGDMADKKYRKDQSNPYVPDGGLA